MRSSTPSDFEIGFCSCVRSRAMKRFRQFDCTEYVCDALQVVCHCREADFDLCTRQAIRIANTLLSGRSEVTSELTVTIGLLVAEGDHGVSGGGACAGDEAGSQRGDE